MRPVLYALSLLAVMGLAFWAYRENYATQKSLGVVENLQAEIGRLREALAVQRAEWAYLNRPDRLRELAAINFDRLGLLPFEPEQFGSGAQVAYPPPPGLFVSGAVDVSGISDLVGEVVPTNELQVP